MNRAASLPDDGVRAVDRAFAAALRRLDPTTEDAVLLGAELASFAVGAGHAALDLRHAQTVAPAEAMLPPAQWRDALRRSRWVATPSANEPAPADAPLVLEGDLLYLRRYREYERRLALGLQRIAAHAPVVHGHAAHEHATHWRSAHEAAAHELAALAPLFAQLFPNANAGDDQARAAALALLRSLLLVTGGPGTGKTTTLARLLVLLIAHAFPPFEKGGPGGICFPPPRIALAAPTGRAADRMAQSLREAAITLRAAGIDEALCAALPTEARTLHRLLGPIPDRPRFRHDAAHPLAYDIVVVDEASMVDLPLMCKLVEAVPDGATLVLVGDPDQLPSVEAGNVLASIVQAAGEGDALPSSVETALAPLFGGASRAHPQPQPRRPRAGGDPWTLPLFEHDTQPPSNNASTPPTPLTGYRVHLRRPWRQTEALDLTPLAEAIRIGDTDRALALLQAQSLRGVHFHPGAHDPLAADTRDALLAPWRALAAADDPAQALAMAARVRLLTALREGPSGATQLNARIEEALAGAQRESYFHGRLLLITENSYRHGLFNGDIGVCLRDPGGATVVWFAGGSGTGPEPGAEPASSPAQAVRGFHPGTLPAHEGAFAMTVHKAQGSEFDTVWLLLPARDSRVLSRELIYTGITRARRELHVAGSAEAIEAALARHAGRWSGLGVRLRGARHPD